MSYWQARSQHGARGQCPRQTSVPPRRIRRTCKIFDRVGLLAPLSKAGAPPLLVGWLRAWSLGSQWLAPCVAYDILVPNILIIAAINISLITSRYDLYQLLISTHVHNQLV